MLYLAIKHLHVTCVALSISGFCLRGFLHLRKSALAGRRWLRIAPHVNDAILLTAAIVLTILIGQYPLIDAWLTAKVFGLIAYIILGALALGAGRSPRLRIGAGLAAVFVFGWIVTVALTKDPLGFLSWPA